MGRTRATVSIDRNLANQVFSLLGKILQREIFFAYPGGRYGRVVQHVDAVDRILLKRHQLDCTSGFAQRFLLSAKTGID